jgi:hypothetical protein
MALNPIIREMVGDALANAIDAAQARLDNETVICRCEVGLWMVEVDGAAVATGLGYDDAIAAVEAL